MKLRVISSVVGLPVIIFAVVYGGDLLLGVLAIIAGVGLYEFYQALKIDSLVLKLVGYIAHMTLFGLLLFDLESYLSYLTALFLMVLLIIYVLNYPQNTIVKVMGIFFGFFYVSYLLSHIYLVRDLKEGMWSVGLIFISAWGSDTFAYLVGMTFGRRGNHKLAPVLSPKKTVEGAIGGMLGATLLSGLYGFILMTNGLISDTFLPIYCLVGLIGSVLAQTGDLAASAIKRNEAIKDFGHVIPGHGGILDRFDSILFTAPFVFYMTLLFLN